MSEQAAQVRQQLTEELHSYWQERYQAYQEGREVGRSLNLMAQRIQAADAQLPAAVEEAYRFYQENLVERDIGTVSLSHLPINGIPVYTIMASTDGDDGWLEVYDDVGECLGVGRTYLELVNWGDRDTLRNQVETGEYPPEMDRGQTLWAQD
ncbi:MULTISPECIES: hypothetical protein [unclassified Leptolyngbya]|uniref:hypothetical protein n=1 Tax=unclassified Leptolyngbya TaxID=2650499 RepID=UPI001688A62E|nr:MULTISPECIES: hypothetical protein [unclassified Leptolyngbya]MBD1911990.1 hypothetical protein [Leptolyngbya sp. FACHB-8]MBD2155360.1 hypothetical protein [Leptolyngbya sp. FACHB-16]